MGFTIRMGWATRQATDPAALSLLPDQREYLEAAAHLQNHEGFWISDERFEHVAFAYRTPGYPFLIRLCAGNIQIVRGFQVILDTSTILAVFLLSRRWLSSELSLFATLLVAFNPYLIFFTGLILSETLFTSMLIWGITLLILSDGPWPTDDRRLWVWISGGLILSLSILVRPGAIALPVLLGIGAALANRPSSPAYQKQWPLPVAATMLLLSAFVLFPWAARNRLKVGAWIWTSTNAGITRYDGFNSDATGASDQKFVQRMPWLSEMTEVGRSQYFDQLADQWIVDHPMQSLWLGAVKIGRTWSPVPLSGDYGSRPVYWWVGIVFGIPLDLLLLLGLLRGKLPRPTRRFLLLPAVYLTIAAALSVGSLRYRIPADPPMAIIAASSLGTLRRPSARNRVNDGVFSSQS
jgi:4-amino-4-deoxy-L-arabinose transferase-like glycosyltransferase